MTDLHQFPYTTSASIAPQPPRSDLPNLNSFPIRTSDLERCG
ncbi:unnamed protein product [Rhodiola kirilowii]